MKYNKIFKSSNGDLVSIEKVVDLAAELVINEVEENGRSYMDCIGTSIQEACIRLGISKDEIYM